MAAKKNEPAIVKIATFLSEHGDFHDLEAICADSRVAKSTAERTLAKLVDSGAVVTQDREGTAVWRWANPVPTAEVAPTEESPHAEDTRPDEGDTTSTDRAMSEPGPEAGDAHAVQAAEAETDPAVEERADVSEADPSASESVSTEPDEGEADGPAAGSGTEEARGGAADGHADAELDGAAAEESEAAGVASTDAAGVSLQPVLLEHDPMVMLMARVLAEATKPLSTRQVAEAAYMPMGTREVLTALRALTASGLAVCSKPFAPTDEDCSWQRNAGLEPDAFMRSARGVPMAAAPDRVTCPICGHSAVIPGVTRPRKRGGDLRSDGSRKLPAGGLKRLAREWLIREENAGDLITPGQLKRELRAEHGDQVSRNCDGALRQLMADQFTKADPADADKRPLLVEEEGITPLTYRIRDLA
ncbi:hypothetical protein K3N28_05790 [Glycomyces sp. TRM65418]|uniref:hypothetical protein n=1 Tax=Glycomyces sp. TRM65418 TaxID=2867006 RepID=UPI001CE5E25F|nr:hypothetical protein [Glycomyces sp. TRM65418]MCC3762580.1 hypothetical protein [Glycomyces sp. TRM65418]QZD56619.1 hypothetical protein K3N28_05750 [Glycomyces sp. TRM65418]